MESMDIELGKRAVACKGWRWMPGMRAVDLDYSRKYPRAEWRVLRVWVDRGRIAISYSIDGEPAVSIPDVYGLLPDLTDHATLGCLLALVRETWGERDIELSILHSGEALLTVQPNDDDNCGERNWLRDSLAEALVAALEAAP